MKAGERLPQPRDPRIPRSCKVPGVDSGQPLHARLLASRAGREEIPLLKPPSVALGSCPSKQTQKAPSSTPHCLHRPPPWSHPTVPSARPEGREAPCGTLPGEFMPSLCTHVLENHRAWVLFFPRAHPPPQSWAVKVT